MQKPSSDFFVFVINTGSTSTKLSFFRNEAVVSSATISHKPQELENPGGIWEQFEMRAGIAMEWLRTLKKHPSAVVSNGGLLKPVPGGTYPVNDAMVEDARSNLQGEHASNLGCAIARRISDKLKCPAYVVDPVSVDEFEEVARFSGHPLIRRKSLSHALNIHAVARLAARRLRKRLDKTSFVVAHLGGGISIAPVKGGKIVDVNDALSDGPFSPERTGGLPLQQFMGICFSGDYSEQEIRRMVVGKGGLRAYLGTTSAREVEERIEKKDPAARSVFEAMAYQIAKEIGAMATVLNGKVDAVLVTGGLAASRSLVKRISRSVRFIAPIQVFPGGDEMKSMALGVLRVLRGEEQPMEY